MYYFWSQSSYTSFTWCLPRLKCPQTNLRSKHVDVFSRSFLRFCVESLIECQKLSKGSSSTEPRLVTRDVFSAWKCHRKILNHERKEHKLISSFFHLSVTLNLTLDWSDQGPSRAYPSYSWFLSLGIKNKWKWEHQCLPLYYQNVEKSVHQIRQN